MGVLDLKLTGDKIYYVGRKQSIFLSEKVIRDVSFYFNKNMEEDLLNIIDTDSVTVGDYQNKIYRIEKLKQEIIKKLVEVRSNYKVINHKIKDGKNISEDEATELENLSSIKSSLISYVNFLDSMLHNEYGILKSLVRKRNRLNNVDMKTSIVLDNDSKFIYDMMVSGKNLGIEKTHAYLTALSYYIKNLNMSNCDKVSCCMRYVKEIFSKLMNDDFLYFENIVDIKLLKQVVRQKAMAYSKDEEEKKSFLNSIVKKIQVLEDRNIKCCDNEIIDDTCLSNIFYKTVNYEKNINLVKSFLQRRPDLVYMTSIQNPSLYYIADIIDKYGNLLLNAKENHDDLEYYGSLVRLYIDTVNTLDNKDINVFILKRLQRVILNVNNSLFDSRRKDACLFEIYECIGKLTNVVSEENEALLQFDATRIHRIYKDDTIFTVDLDNAKLFEQAYSYKEENGYKYLAFYIPDTTELSDFEVSDISNVVEVSSKNNLLSRNMKKKLNLDSLKPSKVIGYHFVIDSSNTVKEMDIRKEEINVSKNLSFSDVDNIMDSCDNNDYYYKTLVKLIDLVDDGTVSKRFDITSDGYLLVTSLSIFFQRELGKYCDMNDIPYISRYIYDDASCVKRTIDEIADNLECFDLSDEQIIKSVKNFYLAGIYTIDKKESIDSERRAKVTTPFRDLVSFINQMVIYHYFTDCDVITYSEALKTKRDLHLITDEMNKQLLESFINDTRKEDKEINQMTKNNNQKIKCRIKRTTSN